MKKLICSTIIILPLLLLAVLLVSGAVVNLLTHIYVESIEFTDKSNIILVMDDKDNPPVYDLAEDVNILPLSASDRRLEFAAANPDLLSISGDGKITPLLYGETYVTVQSRENRAASATRKVIITGTTVHEIVINDCPAVLEVGSSARLSASMFPIDATNKGLRWSSSDESVLKVNAGGTATAVGTGTATIYATNAADSSLCGEVTIECRARSSASLAVYCGDRALNDGGSYKTAADTLTLFAAGNDIQYKTGGGNWRGAEGGKIELSSADMGSVSVRAGEQEISFGVQKTALGDFGVEAFATVDSLSGSEVHTLAKIDSISSGSADIRLSRYVQDRITLSLLTGDDFIGGMDDESFAAALGVTIGEGNAARNGRNVSYDGWDVSYDGTNMQVIISFVNQRQFDRTVELSLGQTKFDIRLERVDISDMTFIGYDGQNEQDVYKGYQQASVFAKHSFYDGEKVDYFRIPYSALGDLIAQTPAEPASIVWTMSRVVGDAPDGSVTVSQRGTSVNINGEAYNIAPGENGYVLKGEDGAVVSGEGGKNPDGKSWIDIYSEPGYARIYFGNVKGLSAGDVFNDYFGAFDDKPWTVPPLVTDDKEGGAVVTPSEGAYSFLRVEAGDGAVGGKNCRFGFNVLDDDKFTNVFDAAGYYANDDIVLHADLYGPYEIPSANPANVLTETKNISKSSIFGNGYRVNLMARNRQLIDAAVQQGDYEISRLGYHNGAAFFDICNLTLMGANPSPEIKPLNQATVFRIHNACYCDIQYIAKVNTYDADNVTDTYRTGSACYYKNTVIRYASRSCYQLSFKGDKAFFENVVFIESNAAITFENERNMTCYFNGFCDVLAYQTPAKLCASLGYGEGLGWYILQTADKYAEWFGKTNIGLDASNMTEAMNTRFVNPALFNIIGFDTTNKALFRKDDGYGEGGYFAANFYVEELFPTWTYNRTVTFDGGQKDGRYYTTRDMSKLFDNPEEVRLLCQYKGLDENGDPIANTDHILWHMQKVYRDPSRIRGRITDHIDALKESLIVSKDADGSERRTGIMWGDGSGISADGTIIDPAA